MSDGEVAAAAPAASTLADHAEALAAVARGLTTTLEVVASGEAGDAALPVLVVTVATVVAASAELAVLEVPGDLAAGAAGAASGARPSDGAGELRSGLARVLTGIDAYDEVVHPLTGAVVRRAAVSADLAAVAEDLAAGLAEHAAGRAGAALAAWQRSCLERWADRAASAQRALLAVVSAVRLAAADPSV